DEAARGAPAHRPLPLAPAQEDRVQESRPLRLRQELAAEADESARRRLELKADAPRAVVDHLRHLPLAAAHRLGDDADELFGAVNHDRLDRLKRLPALRARDDFGLRDLKLVALAPHHLDEDGELQLAAAG